MTRRFAYAFLSAGLAAIVFGLINKGMWTWNTPPYWLSAGLVFIVALLLHNKVE